MEGIINQLEGVDLSGLNQEELVTLVSGIKDEYKALESNTEKGAQSLLWEKKKMEKAIETFKNVNADPEKLEALLNEDKELWQFILDKFYDGQSIDDIKNKKWPNIDEIVEQKLNQKEVDKKLSSVKDQLPDDLLEKFNTEFEELTEGKKLTADNVQKYIKNALSNVSDDSTLLDTIKAGAVWNGGNTKGRPTNEDRGAKSVLNHLKSMGAIK